MSASRALFAAASSIFSHRCAGIRPVSTVEAGTAYENMVVQAFNRLGADLERIGGANDQGIDFRGPWALPKQSQFYVVGQCKHYGRKKIGPSVIREWEGVMSRQEPDTLGVISASSGFTTKGVRTALSSEYPMALVTLGCGTPTVSEDSATKGVELDIRGFVWNKAASEFLGHLVVAKKHYDTRLVHVADPAQFSIQLLWNGEPLPPTSR